MTLKREIVNYGSLNAKQRELITFTGLRGSLQIMAIIPSN